MLMYSGINNLVNECYAALYARCTALWQVICVRLKVRYLEFLWINGIII